MFDPVKQYCDHMSYSYQSSFDFLWIVYTDHYIRHEYVDSVCADNNKTVHSMVVVYMC